MTQPRAPWLCLVFATMLAGCSSRGCSSSSTGSPPARPSFLSPQSEALLGIGQERPVTGGSGTPAPTPAPFSVTTPYYSLSAPADRRADAELLAATLDVAISKFGVDFVAADADGLLRSATVRIHVASAPDEHCGPGHATNRSSWDAARCTAEIHVLAPSAHPDPALPDSPRTSMDEPMDAAYVQRVLVHEYATVLLESICRSKACGWSFWDAPPWFVQGAEEYLGVMYSTPHAREATLGKYKEATRSQSLVTSDWGLDARLPYVSGPVLVAFIHERFGRDAFVAILRSERPTFGSAMRDTLGTTPEAFHAAFAAWLTNQPGSSTDP